jgi:WG repeat protein
MNLNRPLLLGFILIITLPTFAQHRWAHVTNEVGGIKKTGVLNDSGRIIVPVDYDMIIGDKGFYFVRKNGLWGCYNSRGLKFIPTEYQDIGLKISAEVVRVQKKNKWGYVDFNNSTVIDFDYDFACNFQDGKAYVKKGGNAFFIDLKGNLLNNSSRNETFCPEDDGPAIKIASQFQDSLLSPTGKDGNLGVVKIKTGEIIIPLLFDQIGTYFNGTILVRKGNKWGAYTDTGRLITDPKYTSIGVFWREQRLIE